jgi:tetratricopeptide (TPR) repeat protein
MRQRKQPEIGTSAYFARRFAMTSTRFGRAFCVCLLGFGFLFDRQLSGFANGTAQTGTLPESSVLSKSAALAYARAQFGEAERLWRRALESTAAADDTAITWSNVGAAAAAQGRWAEADEAYGRALALVSSDSAIAGNVLNNRAGLSRRAGRLVEAEQDARSALVIAENGNDQAAISSRLHTLATVVAERGQLDEALRFLTRSRDLKNAAGLAGHPDMAATASVTAQVLLLMGRHAEAEELANESLAIARRSNGDADTRIAAALIVLASVYGATGRRADADRLHREVIALLDAKLGKGHPDSARARVDFAGYLCSVGRNQAAIVMYSEALRVYEHNFGAGSPRVVAVQTAIATAREAVGRTEVGRVLRVPVAPGVR